jgi:hypothetical protein
VFPLSAIICGKLMAIISDNSKKNENNPSGA